MWQIVTRSGSREVINESFADEEVEVALGIIQRMPVPAQFTARLKYVGERWELMGIPTRFNTHHNEEETVGSYYDLEVARKARESHNNGQSDVDPRWVYYLRRVS